MAVRWRNWSGLLSTDADALHFLRSEDDAVALVARAAEQARVVRPAGASHSHSPLVPTRDWIVDTSGLCGLIDIDADARTAWMWAGTPIHAVGLPLREAGLALHNQGDIDRQSIGGAVATGTHGTGATLTNLSAAVVGARLVLASGELVDCTTDTRPDLFGVARLSLGAVGVITRLQLQLREAYRLRQTGWHSALDEMLEQTPHRIAAHRHFEFFWYPTRDLCVAKATDETDEPCAYPLGEEGARTAWSHEVLPSHRPWLHSEMEYSVPAEHGIDCLGAIRDLLARDFPTMPYPIEYRTVAADDVWLSPAVGRDSATISVHMAVDEPADALFRACEEVFVAFDGRPHWGKIHHRVGRLLAGCYEYWDHWWRVRDHHDPEGVFVNEGLAALRTEPEEGHG